MKDHKLNIKTQKQRGEADHLYAEIEEPAVIQEGELPVAEGPNRSLNQPGAAGPLGVQEVGPAVPPRPVLSKEDQTTIKIMAEKLSEAARKRDALLKKVEERKKEREAFFAEGKKVQKKE